ncbi:MAG: hypothetical protein WA734_18985, partial [Candidatus Acidiferrales bacterium]
TKVLQLAKIDFGDPEVTTFLEAAGPTRKWIMFCKQGVDHIEDVYRREARQYLGKTGEELTLANYFKASNYVVKILAKPVPPRMKKLAKELSR